MGMPRALVIDESEVGVYHCFARCVRRAFLCGSDRYGRKNFDHRRVWVEEELIRLARCFAVDVIAFAIMGNHFHLVLRNRPDLVEKWSDKEVLLRSLEIYPVKFARLGVQNGQMTVAQRRHFLQDGELIKELRSRLSSISWFMRQLNQKIARKSNKEDEVTGHFFESRFRCIPITDLAGLVLCAMYVDLNQIRAMEASTPETSIRTSAYRRIKGLKARKRNSKHAPNYDGFLCPISARGDGQTSGYSPAGVLGAARASDTGVLDISLEQYLELLDWTGRQIQRGKRGKISEDVPPILERLGLSGKGFVSFIENYRELFRVAVGSAESMAAFSARCGRRWLQGQKRIAEIEKA